MTEHTKTKPENNPLPVAWLLITGYVVVVGILKLFDYYIGIGANIFIYYGTFIIALFIWMGSAFILFNKEEKRL